MRLITLVCLCQVCLVSLSAHAVEWKSLTPQQQEALIPLDKEWNSLPEQQQKRLLNAAREYPRLTPEQRFRFLSRLTAWSKLTPEQRKAARDKYRAFSKIPRDKRDEVKVMVKKEQEKAATPPALSVVPASTVPSVATQQPLN